MTNASKEKAIFQLQKLLNEAIRIQPNYGHSFQKWLLNIDNSFIHIFGKDSRQYSRLPGSYTITPNGIRRHIVELTALIESCVEEIRDFWEDNHIFQADPMIDTISSESSPHDIHGGVRGKKVFVIHGRDERVREMVARFLDKLDLEPVILHEQPNEGRTIIEKFEDYSNVEFFIVLLTSDDLGTLADTPQDLKPRARQNVVFEFGYFIGKLGRDRVCALLSGNIKKLSDYDGVLYLTLDNAGGWKINLIRELRAAGFNVDANKIMEM